MEAQGSGQDDGGDASLAEGGGSGRHHPGAEKAHHVNPAQEPVGEAINENGEGTVKPPLQNSKATAACHVEARACSG